MSSSLPTSTETGVNLLAFILLQPVSSLNSALANYVTNNTLTSQYYKKTDSDTRYLLKSGLAGTGNRLIQALPDGTLAPVVVNSLPPDRILGYDDTEPEDSTYRIGNLDRLDRITEITEQEALKKIEEMK